MKLRPPKNKKETQVVSKKLTNKRRRHEVETPEDSSDQEIQS